MIFLSRSDITKHGKIISDLKIDLLKFSKKSILKIKTRFFADSYAKTSSRLERKASNKWT